VSVPASKKRRRFAPFCVPVMAVWAGSRNRSFGGGASSICAPALSKGKCRTFVPVDTGPLDFRDRVTLISARPVSVSSSAFLPVTRPRAYMSWLRGATSIAIDVTPASTAITGHGHTLGLSLWRSGR
jgi:hypothetical protein